MRGAMANCGHMVTEVMHRSALSMCTSFFLENFSFFMCFRKFSKQQVKTMQPIGIVAAHRSLWPHPLAAMKRVQSPSATDC